MINSQKYNDVKRITIFSVFINTILSILKITVGIIGKSSALIADGIHSISDFFTDIVAFLGVKFSDKPADESHNYGHGKIEPMATIVISFSLLFAGITIARKGIEDIWGFYKYGKELPVPSFWALIVLIVSIVLKELLFHITLKVGKRNESDVIIANAWHHRTDSLSSLAALVGVGLAYILGSKYAILDPISAIVVSIFILKVAFEVLLPNINQLMDTSLSEEEINRIIEILKENDKVKNYHKLRTRKIGQYRAVEAHVLVDENLSIVEAHNISEVIENKIESIFGEKVFINIHIEPDCDKFRK